MAQSHDDYYAVYMRLHSPYSAAAQLQLSQQIAESAPCKITISIICYTTHIMEQICLRNNADKLNYREK